MKSLKLDMKIYKNIHEVIKSKIENITICCAKVDEYRQSGFLWWKKEYYLGTKRIVNMEGYFYFLDSFQSCSTDIDNLYLNYISENLLKDKERRIKFILEHLTKL